MIKQKFHWTNKKEVPYGQFYIKYLSNETGYFNKVSTELTNPERKSTADMIYGILASGSRLLTDIVDQLYEE